VLSDVCDSIYTQTVSTNPATIPYDFFIIVFTSGFTVVQTATDFPEPCNMFYFILYNAHDVLQIK
jgi:hypothetical protein